MIRFPRPLLRRSGDSESGLSAILTKGLNARGVRIGAQATPAGLGTGGGARLGLPATDIDKRTGDASPILSSCRPGILS
eukprot:3928934-Rhodomonas_salina.1